MSEKSIISPEAAKLAAENIANALDGDDSSPINSEHIRNFFELAFIEDNVWMSFMAMMNLLTKSHGELLSEKEIHVDVVILTEYLLSIRLGMLEEMAAENIKDEIEELRVLTAPVVKELTEAGKEKTAELILKYLSELIDHPFDAGMNLFSNLQVAQSMGVVTGEVAKKNLATLYERTQKLLEVGIEAKLNYKQ